METSREKYTSGRMPLAARNFFLRKSKFESIEYGRTDKRGEQGSYSI